MENEKTKSSLNIGVKAFLISLAVIFALMIVAYILAETIPGGAYPRAENEYGDTVIYIDGAEDSFEPVEESGIAFWRWLLSPILVLGAEGSGMLLAIIAFLLVIGGAFTCMEQCGLMRYMLSAISHRFGHSRYRLMAILILFFMAMGSLIGSFEECVPMVPIVVALSIELGWDAITGFAMSLLAAGCGFAAGVFNPFSVGVAQRLAGVPMFSGFWYRAVAFVLIYGLLLFFVRRHAKKVEQAQKSERTQTFVYDRRLSRALTTFAVILGAGIAAVMSSAFIEALRDLTIVIVPVMFLIAGVTATLVAGMDVKKLCKTFGSGALAIMPAVVMILMASSIKYILEEAKVLDTILHACVETAGTLPTWTIILFVYLLVLLMNFFVASGSAKACMIMPLIVPLATSFGIAPQLCVMAYAFGDGFSNVFYPTNAALLLGLNLAGIGYGKWVKWSWKFQFCNLLLTSGLLLLGFAIGYC